MAKKRIKRILTYTERRKRARRKRFLILFFFLFLLILFFVGVIYLIRLNNFRVNNIEVSGVSDDKKEEVKKEIKDIIGGNRYFFIPKDGIAFISSKEINEDLQKKFSFIQGVKTEKNYPRTLAVSIIERMPAALYCQSDCYFIDQTGFIYSKASSVSSGVYMIYEDRSRSASSSPLMTFLTDQNTLNELKNYIDEIKKLGLNPEKTIFITSREVEIDNNNNGHILVNLERPFEETIQNIKTVFLNGVTNFEYIDARYGNKIFYK